MLSRRQFLLAGSALSLVGCSRQSREEPVWFGHIAPLTGSERGAGIAQRNGVSLAVKYARDNRGKGERPVAVLHADSRGQIDQARHEAVRLVSLNKVLGVIGGREQLLADRVGQALQPYLAPLVSPAARGKTPLEGVFSLDVAAEFRGRSLARFAAEQYKGKRALILADDRIPVCAAVASAFADQWRAVASQTPQTWDLHDRESKDLPQRLKQSGAELLLFAGKASDLPGGGKLDLPVVFGGEEVEWRRLQTAAGIEATIHGAVVHVLEHFTEEAKAFVENYRKEHHEKPDPEAWRGYESMRVLIQALWQARGGGASGLRERLTKSDDLQGLTGKLSFKQGQAVRPLYIVGLKESGVVKEFQPE